MSEDGDAYGNRTTRNRLADPSTGSGRTVTAMSEDGDPYGRGCAPQSSPKTRIKSPLSTQMCTDLCTVHKYKVIANFDSQIMKNQRP